MTTCTASQDRNIRIFNPFLSETEANEIITFVMLLMMAVNRISQVNLALSQAHNVNRILQTLKSADDAKRNVLLKELLSAGGNLAATVGAKREYATVHGTSYTIDPRFLLFEFSHNILLRKAQVELVRKLMEEMKAGHSVCHQVKSHTMLFYFSNFTSFR